MATTNDIPSVQNQEQQLALRQAAGATYDKAMRVAFLQVLLTVILPAAGLVLSLLEPSARPHVAALALFIVVADTTLLDRRHKHTLKLAARFSEQFDCKVLQLPWDSFTAGDRPTAEERHRAKKGRQIDGLADWYPVDVGEMPIHLARFVCQRTNLRYDSQLRRYYSAVVLALSLSVMVALVVYGMAAGLSLPEFVLLLTPATPLLTWSLRESLRQKDGADALEKLMKEAQRAWNGALANGRSQDDCLRQSREFQSAIFLRRSTLPSVFPFFYVFKRESLEDEMDAAAFDFRKQYAERLTFSAGLTPDPKGFNIE